MGLITTLLGPLLSILSAKFGIIGTFGAYAIALVPAMTLLIELIQLVVNAIGWAGGESVAAEVDNVWENYVLPVLEVVPHANIPIAATIGKVIAYLNQTLAAIMAAINAWKNPPAPPAPPVAS